jgi:hypothetical protein
LHPCRVGLALVYLQYARQRIVVFCREGAGIQVYVVNERNVQYAGRAEPCVAKCLITGTSMPSR